jgi:hypothetical protein
MRDNVSDRLDQARTGRVVAERKMGPHLVIIGGIFHKDSSKVLCIERDQRLCHADLVLQPCQRFGNQGDAENQL